ncbi:hypothetical protein GEMRC1_009361 [Eukaryota sp. GEM-RC1]
MNSTSVFESSASVLHLSDVNLSKLITNSVFDLSDSLSAHIFNVSDSPFNLSSIILNHSNADAFITCLHCNGSMDNLLIENSSFTSLFHLDYGSMSFNTTSLTKINTSLAFGNL